MRYFLESFQGANVVKGFNAGRKPSMQAEELILDDSGQRDEVEEFSQAFPNIGISIFAATLIVKAIDLSDLS